MSEYIHIVCLDAPAPPDYGGAIDMYHKITSLAAIGKKIILHYFDYNKERNVAGIEKYCSEIHAYKRDSFFHSFSFTQPYIARSRINQSLIDRLNEGNHPIILEGIHCTGIIPYLNKRSIVVRMHNEEPSYYKKLAATDKNLIKRSYLALESFLLKQYQKKLAAAEVKYACLSHVDIEVLKNNYGFHSLHFIPCFIPWQTIRSKDGKGDYCLYHGNMKISENEAAVEWLIKKVFSKLDITLVIAGQGISKRLLSMCNTCKNIKTISDPSMEELSMLIRDAHINVLPSMNTTGVKLKLLHALFEGRFCITNTNGVKGSGMENAVTIANHPNEYVQMIPELYEKSFIEDDKKNRQQLLTVYNNLQNAEKLNALL